MSSGMNIKVLARPAEVVKSTWDGKETTRHQQWAVIEIDGLPTAFTVSHNTPEAVLPPGDYELEAKSFSVKNGRLTMDRPVLRPVAVASVSALKPSQPQAAKA